MKLAEAFCVAGLVLWLAGGTGAALAARSDWTIADKVRMRLLLVAPSRPDAPLEGGIELALEPGWHTYWRQPGDVGVPPRFDFSGSSNVRSVEVRYPFPERRNDETGLSLVYSDDVVLPITVIRDDPGQPVELDLVAAVGVCRDICVPVTAEARLGRPDLDAADPLAEARLAAFRPKVPGPPVPGKLEFLPASTEGDHLLIPVRMPDAADADLLAEAPPGWFVGQPTLRSRADGVSTYTLDLAMRPKGAPIDADAFRFSALADGRAAESRSTPPDAPTPNPEP